MRKIVVYRSKTGFTQKYAKIISEELEFELIELDSFKSINKDNIEWVIFGGPIYLGRIKGLKVFFNLIRELSGLNVIIFGVGMEADFGYLEHNMVVESGYLGNYEDGFFLKGGLDYNKLSFCDKLLLRLRRGFVLLKSKKKNVDYDLINSINKKIDYFTKGNIYPILDYYREFKNT